MEANFNSLLAELNRCKLRIKQLEKELSEAKDCNAPIAPTKCVVASGIEAHMVQPAPCTRPVEIASAATCVDESQAKAGGMPPPPFVAVLRRHGGLCRNYALHGLCAIVGCNRRHEVVTPAVERDIRCALRDKRMSLRRGPVRVPPPRAASQ